MFSTAALMLLATGSKVTGKSADLSRPYRKSAEAAFLSLYMFFFCQLNTVEFVSYPVFS